jgi:hypothetical protein
MFNAVIRTPVILAILGWLSFVLGNCSNEPFILKLVLLSAARALPRSLTPLLSPTL